MHSLTYRLMLDDENVRRAVITSFRIESEESRTDRAEFSVSEDGNIVEVIVTARDLVMLRAFSNSVFRILKTCVEVAEVII